MTMTSSTEPVTGARDRDSAPEERRPAGQDLRAETCAILDGLDAAAKGRANIVRSCTEIRNLSDDDRDALKDLLRCITEQRKRLRALRRLWQSLDGFERPTADLVEVTELCVRENAEIATALDPWRLRTLGHVAQSVSATWLRLARIAPRFTAERAENPVADARAAS
jgi:hypothetical protein